MPDPSRFLTAAPDAIDDVVERIVKGQSEVEILVLVGWPGAGKVTPTTSSAASF